MPKNDSKNLGYDTIYMWMEICQEWKSSNTNNYICWLSIKLWFASCNCLVQFDVVNDIFLFQTFDDFPIINMLKSINCQNNVRGESLWECHVYTEPWKKVSNNIYSK